MLKVELCAQAPIVVTTNRVGKLELLLNTLTELLALRASEGANLQLWLDLSRPRDSTLNRHDLSQAESLEISDLVHTWQVEEANVEPLVVRNHVTLISQESGQSLAQIRLEP